MNKRTLGLGGLGLLTLIALWFGWQTMGRDAVDSPPKKAEVVGNGVALRHRVRIAPREQKPGSVAGTVSTHSGQGIAGALVCVTPRSKELAGEETKVPRCTQTDANGRYEISSLVPAKYRPEASARGFEPGGYRAKRRGESDSVVLGPGEQVSHVDIQLVPGGVLVSGFVLDVGGGGVAEARVWGQGLDGRRNGGGAAHGTTTDDGAFELWLPEGLVNVMAAAEGYASSGAQASAPGSTVEILLTPEAVLAGRVVEAESGSPVARARVVANQSDIDSVVWSEWEPFEGAEGSAFTDDTGRFRITGLKPGRYKPSATIAGGYGESDPSVRLGLGQTEEDVVIELQPVAVVTGRVLVGEGDVACTNGGVSLERSDDSSNQAWSSIESDDGRVEFLAVLPGTYQVRVRCNSKQSRNDYDEVDVGGKDIEGLVWRVNDGASVAGTVRSTGGKAVDRGTVFVEGMIADNPRAQKGWGTGDIESDGSYRIEGLVPGKAKVTAEVEGFSAVAEAAQTELVAGQTASVDIELSAGGTIRGKVVDEQGVPVANLVVEAQDMGKTNGWAGLNGRMPSRDDGTFEMAGLAAGRYRVKASGARTPGNTDDDVSGEVVEVVEGQVANVTVSVESRNKVIVGTVVNDSGAPITDAYVSAVRDSDAAGAVRGGNLASLRWGLGGGRSVVTDTDGAFVLEKLTEGTYTVQAYRRGGGEALLEGVVTGASVELRMKTPGSIAGRVVAPGGPPLLFTLNVHDKVSGFMRSERFVGTRGSFTMGELPAGTYQCSVTSEQGTGSAKVPLKAGAKVEGVELKVAGRVTVTGRVVDVNSRKPVSGLRMHASLAGASAFSMGFTGKDASNSNVTDAEGRFTIANAPQGKVDIMGIGVDWEESPYQWIQHRVTITPGRQFDVGDLTAVKRRVGKDEPVGDLGFTLKRAEPGTELENHKLVVALVRPGGPAAESGLQVGDQIVSVDGKDITGNVTLYWNLARVTPGTRLKLGLGRGDIVSVTAGSPRE